jgi:hypothetical protein
MREFGRVPTSLTTGPTGRALRGKPWAYAIATYLFSGRPANLIGLFSVPLPTIAHELGAKERDVRQAMGLLQKIGLVKHDESADLVFLPGAARLHLGETMTVADKRHKHVLGELALHGSHPFVDEFLARYAEAYHLPRSFEGPSQAPPNGHVKEPRSIREKGDLETGDLETGDQEKGEGEKGEGRRAAAAAAPGKRPAKGGRAAGLFETTLASFCAAWAQRYRAAYEPTPADRNQLGHLLNGLSQDAADALPEAFRAYLRDNEKFVAEKMRHSLKHFCAEGGVNKYRVRAGTEGFSERDLRGEIAKQEFLAMDLAGGSDGRGR